MKENNQTKSKVIRMSLLNIALVILIVLQIVFFPTIARYVKQESDKIVATYTSLYLDSDGNGKIVSVEGDIGYLNIKLMNYEDSNVTQRDIVYSISTPSVFYDKNAKVITDVKAYLDASEDNQLYVLDVWGEPQVVGRDTYKYVQSVAYNDGEEATNINTVEPDYKFSYEKLNNSAVGKIHNVLVKFQRSNTVGSFTGTENVSIVVHLSEPYKEVFIINIKISDKLIVFSNVDTLVYETTFQRLYIQTADLYSHYKDNIEKLRTYNKRGVSTAPIPQVKIAPRAILITLQWDNFYFDVNCLKQYHLQDDNIIGSIADNNLDISKPYVKTLDIANKTLTMYVPQASNFYLDFLQIDKSKASKVDINIQVAIIDGDNAPIYDIYDEIYGGYNQSIDFNGAKYMNVINFVPENN